jgi:predicted AAA+ superfamily ATPase
MAKVIYRLWKDDNKDLLIMPGSLPLHDGSSRNELTYYLPAGWDPVIERDIDGERAETTALEGREPRFGQVGAARRIARTIFLGSAPSSVVSRTAARGLDRAHIILGCLQPGQTSSVYADALSRLADRLHYLNASGDKSQDATRFWFDTRANLRREMEDRKRRFDDKTEVRGRIAETVKKAIGGVSFFDGVHIFTPHADVPDDTALRLVILPPEAWYTKDETRPAFDVVLDTVAKNGSKPRYRSNRLIFVAADHAALSRMNDVARTVLAWASIVDDVKEGRLNIDLLQKNQADKELKSAEDVLPRAIRECYKWLLCPMHDAPTDPKPGVEAFALNTTGGSAGAEIERVCSDNELVITTWSPIHLRTKLKELYWKNGQVAANAGAFFEDTLRYLYMPRLKSKEVLAQAIHTGAKTKDFFGTAYGQSDGKFDGFALGNGNVVFDDTLLLIEPEAARAYDEVNRPPPTGNGSSPTMTAGTGSGPIYPSPGDTPVGGIAEPGAKPPTPGVARHKSFFGAVEIPPATAKMRLVQIADEIVSVLASDPNASIRLTVEISADFPSGAGDAVKRAVSENARSLGLKTADWE